MTQRTPPKIVPQDTGASLIERAAALYAQNARQAVAPASKNWVAQTAAAPSPVEPPVREEREAPQPENRIAAIDLNRLQRLGFLVPDSPPTPLSEAFRVAKRHVLLSAFGGRASAAVDRGRAIVISSAQPNEGKTFSSINLALSLAGERDIEVLLVDADSIKPEVLSNLGLSGQLGLMDALAAGREPEGHILRTSIPNLSVLPAGQRTHNDTELLASKEMRDFVERYLHGGPTRLILFDTAPALAASSGPAISAHAGQVVLVVRADETGEAELAQTVQLFGSGCKLQLLLNRVSFQRQTGKYGAYYGYGG